MQIAMVFIFAACVLYSVGVWTEKFQGRLEPWHLATFWLGLVCDTIGTGAMGQVAGSLIQFNFHGLTGLVAILVMLFHAVWATRVVIARVEKRIVRFHRFSLVVWVIWMVPMVTGMVMGVKH